MTTAKRNHRPRNARVAQAQPAEDSGTPAVAADELFVSAAGRADRPLDTLQAGTHLGRFVIERALSHRGGVYLAHDTIAARPVAIKIARAGQPAARLRREQQLYGRIGDHRHLLRAFDLHPVTWSDQDLLVLSMEYADGGNLRQWLGANQNHPQLRRQAGLLYFQQCCAGAGVLHQAGIVHLDLKPENLLLAGRMLKVADLGSARALSDLEDAAEAGETPPSLGTPPYMSPERGHEAISIQADIYSLGVILHEILHPEGRLPFDRDPSGDARRTGSLPGVEPGHIRVMQGCLHPDPQQRYRSIDELLDDLDGRVAQARIDTLWQQACRHLQQKQPDDARRLCRLVAEQDPQHADARRLLAELDERAQRTARLYALIGQRIDTMGLNELSELVQQAVQLYANHPDGLPVLIQLSARARRYRQAMQNGQAAAREGQWDSALSWLRQAAAANPGAIEAGRPAQAIESILRHVNEQRQQIDQAVAQGDGPRALALARSLDEFTGRAVQSFNTPQNGGHYEHPDPPDPPVPADPPDPHDNATAGQP